MSIRRPPATGTFEKEPPEEGGSKAITERRAPGADALAARENEGGPDTSTTAPNRRGPDNAGEAREAAGRGSPLRRLWRIAQPSQLRLLAAVVLGAGALVSSVGLLVVSAWLISRASERPPILFLQVAIVTVRALGISRAVLRYAERLVGHDAALRSLTDVRLAVYARLERLSPAGLGRHRRGDLLARMVGDVDTAVDLVVRVVVPALAAAVAGLVAVLIGWALVPAAGAVLLATVVVTGGLAPWLVTLTGARARSGRAQAEGALSAELVGSLDAAAELRAFGVVDRAIDRIEVADARLSALDRRAAFAGGLGNGLTALATNLSLVACLWLGATAVRGGALDGVWLATLVLLPLALADVLSGMIPAALARARVVGAARRLLAVMDAPDPVPTPGGAEPYAASPLVMRTRPQSAQELADLAPRGLGTKASGLPPRHHLDQAGEGAAAELDRVAARHPNARIDASAGPDLPRATGRAAAGLDQVTVGHPDTEVDRITGLDLNPATHAAARLDELTARYRDAEGDAIAGLDLELRPGRRIGLVGPSGSGKSTAVAVLLRLLDHRAGSYTFLGEDVRAVSEDDVRSTIGALDQHPHLFDTTIEENVRLARRDATAEEVRTALEAADLTAWIDGLPAGLATRVGDHGARVSGGEAQRIALARLLLADRPIVLLDEPGEHLDAAAADRVTRAALDATDGRTVLLVTHRMSHTVDCDEVVVLSAGRVVDRGAPADLGGWYAENSARQRGWAPHQDEVGRSRGTNGQDDRNRGRPSADPALADHTPRRPSAYPAIPADDHPERPAPSDHEPEPTTTADLPADNDPADPARADHTPRRPSADRFEPRGDDPQAPALAYYYPGPPSTAAGTTRPDSEDTTC